MFNFTTTSDFQIGTASFKSSNLTASYTASTSTYTLQGNAAATLGSNVLNIGLGTGGSAGLVVVNGQLSQLGFTTNASIIAGGLTIKASPLVSSYSDTNDTFKLTGTASFGFQGNTVQLGLGANSTSGLVISAGTVTAIGGTITSDISLGGLTFKALGLTTTYVSSTSTLTIAGQTSFTSGGATFAVDLGATVTGGAATKGLVITNGSLTSLDAALTGNFTISSVTFSAESLRLLYYSSKSQYTVTGSASFTTTDATKVSLSLGSGTTKGLVITNGSVESLDAAVTGNFTISSVTFAADSLRLVYDSGKSQYTVTGSASFTTTGGSKVTLALGSPVPGGSATQGLVIANGAVSSLDAAVTGSIAISGTTIAAEALRLVYDSANSRYMVTGGASFTTTGGTKVTLALGSPVPGGAATQGLVISNGAISSLDAAVTGSIAISGVTFAADSLRLVYDAANSRYTVTGGASFTTTGGTKVSLVLGSATTQGLVIFNGNVSSLDASVTGSFTVSSVAFAATSLRLVYDASKSTYTVTGDATLTFTPSSGTPANLAVTFGTPTTPGLTLTNGSITNMDLTATGDVTISGVAVTLTGLHLLYSSTDGKYTVSGDTSLTTPDGTVLAIKLGGALPDGTVTKGLVIDKGSVSSVDATLRSNFTVSSVNFATKSLRLTYDAAKSTYTMTGDATLTFTPNAGAAAATLAVTFGSPATPGLTITNGSLAKMDLTATGDVTVSGVTVALTGLHLLYSSADSKFTVSGDTSLTTTDGTVLAIKLGGSLPDGTVTKGLVIDKGSVSSVDATLRSNFTVSSVNFATKSLRLTYDAAKSTYTMTGDATLMFTPNSGGTVASLAVAFGAPATPGLTITNGALAKMDLTATGDVTVSGVTVTLTGLHLLYSSADRKFTVSGDTSLTTTDGTVLAIKLGGTLPDGTVTKGLVIDKGSVSSVDATLRSNFTVSSVNFATKSLRLTYDAAKSTYTMTGDATLMFTPNSGGASASLAVTFGSPATPGLTITNGSLTKMDLTATGDVTVSGVTVTLTGLHLLYSSTNGKFTVSGDTSLKTTDGTVIAVKLGGTEPDGTETQGLVITKGSVSSLDATLRSSFTVSSVNFATKSLRLTYNAAKSTYAMTGDATLTFAPSAGAAVASLAVTFGAPVTPGLTITNGSIAKMDLTATGDVTVSGVTVALTGLHLLYSSADSKFAVSGDTSLTTTDGTVLAIKLGGTLPDGTVTKGLVIDKGSVSSVDATLRSNFTVSSVNFSTKSLRLTYDAAKTTYTITGDATLTFAPNSGVSAASLAVTFGALKTQGLTITNGSITKMDLTATGDVTVSGVTVTLTGLHLLYSSADSKFTISGDTSLKTTDGTVIAIKLGGTEPDGTETQGLVVSKGIVSSVDATVRSNFSVSSLNFTSKSLRLTYHAAKSTFTMTGDATLEFAPISGAPVASLALAFGVPSAPGLSITNGVIAKLDLTATGDITVSGVTVSLTGLHLLYSSVDSRFTVSGDTSLKTTDGTVIAVKLGGTEPDGTETKGLVITHGKVSSLDAAVRSSFTVSSVDFTSKSLRLKYDAATATYALTGDATLTFTPSSGSALASLAVKFGTPATPGLKITNGAITKMDLTADGSMTVSGVTFTFTEITLTYTSAGGIFTATGAASLRTIDGTTVDVKLGAKEPNGTTTKGLVIEKGKVTSLDAAVSGNFTVSQVTFSANSLRLTYDAVGSVFTVTGSATMSFTPSSGAPPSSLAVTFGTSADKRGLVIRNGGLTSMALLADGNITISGVTLTFTGLTLAYIPAGGAFTATGTASFKTADGTTIELTLGGKEPNGSTTKGLVIDDGKVLSVDAAVTGSFQVSKVKFDAQSLRLVYDGLSSTYSMSGAATMTFTPGSGAPSSLAVTFGTAPGKSGLTIQKGVLTSMDLLANGNFRVSGLTLAVQNLSVQYSQADPTIAGSVASFSATGDLSFKARDTTFAVHLAKNGLHIQDGQLKSLDATVASNFNIAGVTFATNGLRFDWSHNRFAMSGSASATFNAGNVKSTIAVGFGTAEAPGLVFSDGTFKSMSLNVTGKVMIAGLSIKADNLTFLYNADLSKFIMFGAIEISTTSTNGTQVLSDVKADLGKSLDAPGIEIMQGSLDRLDIVVNGTVNLGPLTATAQGLRVAYDKSLNALAITGSLDVKVGPFMLKARLPGRGMQINTVTGEVSVDHLQLQVGGFKIGGLEVKNFELDYSNVGGILAVGGKLDLVILSTDVSATFLVTFENHHLASLALSVKGDFQIGSLTVTSFGVSIKGINTGSLDIVGTITANVKVGGANLIRLEGRVEINSRHFQISASAVIFDEFLLKGQATVTMNFVESSFSFTSNITGLGGTLQGNVDLKVWLKTGYFNFDAGLDLIIPKGIKYIGGISVGTAKFSASYGPQGSTLIQGVLPASLAKMGTGSESQRETYMSQGDHLNIGDIKYSPDHDFELILQPDGNLVEYFVPTMKAVWASGTNNSGTNNGRHADLQSDGNFVLYSAPGNNSSTAIWSSNTHGNPGMTLRIQNDGNVVLYKANNGGAGWATNTNQDLGKRFRSVVILGATMEADFRKNFIAQEIAKGEWGSLTELQLSDFIKATQTKVTRTHSGGILKLSGELRLNLGIELGLSGSYVADLNSGDFIAKLGYRASLVIWKVTAFSTSDEFTILSRGNPNAAAGSNRIEIVTSLPSSPSAAARTLRSAALAAPAAASSHVTSTIDPAGFAAELANVVPAPTGSVTGIAMHPQTNSATINYMVNSELGGEVSLFVDIHSSGHQGQQIDPGLLAGRGLQTFDWADVADSLPANYSANQKLYFYLEINDGIHPPVFSPYSVPVTPPNFHPTIDVPAAQMAMFNTPLVFSKSNGNGIRITDPIEKLRVVDATSPDINRLTVILDTTGQGNLKLGRKNSNVTVVGDGSEEMILTGTASDIDEVLDGLSYTSLTDAKAETLTVEVRRANSMYLGSFVSSSIRIEIQDLRISGLTALKVKADGAKHSVFGNIVVKDAVTDTIKSMTVSIGNYHPGKDFLTLNPAGLQGMFAEGISTVFDANTGVLRFTGGAVTAAHAQHLLRHVQFATTDAHVPKRITVELHDELNNVGKGSEVTPPAVLSGLDATVTYVKGGKPLSLAPHLVVTDSNIVNLHAAVITFTNWQNEDHAEVKDMFALQHAFKEDLTKHTATLTITGNDTIEHYQTMLRSVVYRDDSTTPVTTSRSLEIWVYDGVSNSNVVASHLTVAVGKSAPALSAITISPVARKVVGFAASPAIPVASLASNRQVPSQGTALGQTTHSTLAMMASPNSTLPLASSNIAVNRSVQKPIQNLTPSRTSGFKAVRPSVARISTKASETPASESPDDTLMGIEGTKEFLAPNGLSMLDSGPGLDIIDGGAEEKIVIAHQSPNDEQTFHHHDPGADWISSVSDEPHMINFSSMTGVASSRSVEFHHACKEDMLSSGRSIGSSFSDVDDVMADLFSGQAMGLL